MLFVDWLSHVLYVYVGEGQGCLHGGIASGRATRLMAELGLEVAIFKLPPNYFIMFALDFDLQLLDLVTLVAYLVFSRV